MHKADKLTIFRSLNLLEPSRPVQGLLYLHLFMVTFSIVTMYNTKTFQTYLSPCMDSGFCHGINSIFALLGFYKA